MLKKESLLLFIFMLFCGIAYTQRRGAVPFIKVADIQYASYPKTEAKLNMLDVYMPKKGSNSPVLIWIHGGSWAFGDKDDVQAKADYFTEKGYVFVAVNYRLSPKVMHPVHAQDVANAIMWFYSNAKHYSADPKKFFLIGHSAGAHLAALVSIDDKYLKNAGGSTEIVKGVVLLDGTGYDIPEVVSVAGTRLKDWYTQAFGNSKWDWGQASPSNFINTNNHIPSFMIVNSGEGEQLEVESKNFYKKLMDVKVPCKLVKYPKKNQSSLNKDLGKDEDVPTEDILRFLQERVYAIKN
jgi:arylformamidase